MSFRSYHIYGIGINTDNINTTAEKVRDFIALAPNFKKDFSGELTNSEYNQINDFCVIEDLFDNNCDDYFSLGAVISKVVFELEHISLVSCENFDNINFCVFCPMYPWVGNVTEKSLTEEQLKEIFTKYVAYLTDQPLSELDYGYQEIENGG